MPANIPPELHDKWKSCFDQLTAKGYSEASAAAICYSSVIGGKALETAIAEFEAQWGAVEATTKATKATKAAKLVKGARHIDGRKCYDDCDYCAYSSPVGGAISLDALEAARAIREQTEETRDLSWDFQDVVSNIIASPDVPDKAGAIAAEVRTFEQRIGDIWTATKAKVKALTGLDHPKSSDHFAALVTSAKANGSALTAFRAKDGSPRWLGVFTNNFQDAEGETFTKAAHEEFAAWLDANPEQAPELWTWHIPGTARKSRADFWDFDGNFFWMGGPLTEDELTEIERSAPHRMSHQYNGIKSDDNTLALYRSFEVSILLPGAEANQYTDFVAGFAGKKGLEPMGKFTPERRKYLVAMYGEDRVSQLETQSEQTAQALKAAGVPSKAKTEPVKVEAAGAVKVEAGKKEDAAGTEVAGAAADGMTMPDGSTATTTDATKLVTDCINMCQSCADLCDTLSAPEAATCAEACRACSQACAALLGVGVKSEDKDVNPAALSGDLTALGEVMAEMLTAVKVLSAKQAEQEKKLAALDRDDAAKLSALTSPRVPAASLIASLKAAGAKAEASAEDLGAEYVSWTEQLTKH